MKNDKKSIRNKVFRQSLLLSSRIDFDGNTKITINNQRSPEIKNRAIFGSTKVVGDGKVL
jgi:hypothetical protein